MIPNAQMIVPGTCDDCKYEALESTAPPCDECSGYSKHEPMDGEICLNKPEMVDHPAHYNQHSIEPIDVIEDWDLNFNLGSTVKYIARCDYKEQPIQDLEKAAWYLNREIERRKKENAGDQ